MIYFSTFACLCCRGNRKGSPWLSDYTPTCRQVHSLTAPNTQKCMHPCLITRELFHTRAAHAEFAKNKIKSVYFFHNPRQVMLLLFSWTQQFEMSKLSMPTFVTELLRCNLLWYVKWLPCIGDECFIFLSLKPIAHKEIMGWREERTCLQTRGTSDF